MTAIGHDQQAPTHVPPDPAQTPPKLERQLDDAIEDSFPASDPVSLAMPHDFEPPPERARAWFDARHTLPLVLIGGIATALLLARRR
jgi:hypothetical protein